jgi:hypothetical protein
MRSSSERLARRRFDGGPVAELVFALALGSLEVPEGRACGLGGSGAGEAEDAAGLERKR